MPCDSSVQVDLLNVIRIIFPSPQTNGLMNGDHANRPVRSTKWSPPDSATQAMRLQRETDFLKYVSFHCLHAHEHCNFFFVPLCGGHHYDCLFSSSMMLYLLCYPLSAPHSSYLSYKLLSPLGLVILLFFSLVFSHLAFFSLRACPITWPYQFSCVSVSFWDACTILVVSLMHLSILKIIILC